MSHLFNILGDKTENTHKATLLYEGSLLEKHLLCAKLWHEPGAFVTGH